MIDGRAIGEAIIGMAILAFFAGAAMAVAAIYGVPFIWAIVKPFIHSWTA